MAKNVVAQQSTLPGLMPDRDARQLVERFHVFEEGGTYVANRLPDTLERQMLQRRLEELDAMLTPIQHSAQLIAQLELRLNVWLGGYTTLIHVDAAQLITSYKVRLQGLPWRAVDSAIRSVEDGTARRRDGKGREIGFDPDYAPSAQSIYELAVRFLRSEYDQQGRIIKILGVTKTSRGETVDMDMAERARSAIRVQTANDVFQKKMAAEEKHRRSERGDTDESRQRKASERERRVIEDRRSEYVAAGLDAPVGDFFPSLSWMLKAGHTIEQMEGRKVLVGPRKTG